MNRIDVLDHGFVGLVDHMGSDLAIVRNARVSYDAEWRAGEDKGSDSRLINYLYTNGHNTPFESVVFTFDVKAPIFVFRQWHRHRTQCLSGDTRIKFARPCDGKPYWKTIGELAEQWFYDKDVKRKDKQKRSQQSYNRERIKSMKLWCIDGGTTPMLTHITDVMLSGEKEVFEMTCTRGNKIKASKDHRFLTKKGWKVLGDIVKGDKILSIGKTAPEQTSIKPMFTNEELQSEEWRVTRYKDLSVSNLGRVCRRECLLVPTINAQGREVVSYKAEGCWNVVQVSSLVAECFLSGSGFVLHKDDCPTNNRATNLVYGTDQENHDMALANGRRAFNGVVHLEVDSIKSVGVEMTYDIEVAHKDHNFIAENFCTHNSYNELSARYKELPEEFYIPEPHLVGKQNADNKQMRDPLTPEEYDALPESERESIEGYLDDMQYCNEGSFVLYRELIESGMPRELARSVLPVSTYSHMFATVNLNNLFKFLGERLHIHAQYEIFVYAKAILELIEPIVPVAVKAFKEGLSNETRERIS